MATNINAAMHIDSRTVVTGTVQDSTGAGVIKFSENGEVFLNIFLGRTSKDILLTIANIRTALNEIEVGMIDVTAEAQDRAAEARMAGVRLYNTTAHEAWKLSEK